MKKGILATIVILALIITSCSKKPSELIIGVWKVSDFALSQNVSPEIKKAQKETFDEMKASSSLIFNQNGTYHYIITQDTVIGKWVLSEDSKTLTLTYPDGQQEISNIVELTESKLVTTTKINEFENTITFEKEKK